MDRAKELGKDGFEGQNMRQATYNFAVLETRVGYKGQAVDCFRNSAWEAIIQGTPAAITSPTKF